VEITETDDLILDFFGAQPPSASSPGASSSKESSLGPHSPQNLESLWSSDPFLQSADCLWNEDVTSIPEIPDVNMDFSYPCCIDPKDFVPSLEFNMDPMNMPTSNTKMKKFVDVEKFLNSMLLNFV